MPKQINEAKEHLEIYAKQMANEHKQPEGTHLVLLLKGPTMDP